MKDYYIEVLTIATDKLSRKLDPDHDLTAKLASYKVLSLDQLEDIYNPYHNKTRAARVQKIIELLKLSTDTSYRLFKECLKEIGRSDLFNYLNSLERSLRKRPSERNSSDEENGGEGCSNSSKRIKQQSETKKSDKRKSSTGNKVSVNVNVNINKRDRKRDDGSNPELKEQRDQNSRSPVISISSCSSEDENNQCSSSDQCSSSEKDNFNRTKKRATKSKIGTRRPLTENVGGKNANRQEKYDNVNIGNKRNFCSTLGELSKFNKQDVCINNLTIKDEPAPTQKGLSWTWTCNDSNGDIVKMSLSRKHSPNQCRKFANKTHKLLWGATYVFKNVRVKKTSKRFKICGYIYYELFFNENSHFRKL